ncbi:hypothetical protein JCM10207_000274, partial [Rhodosporidiobolus poonsookiae]
MYHDPAAEQPPAVAYDAYGSQSKREKRRREMSDRVTRLQEDTVARRDR